MYVHTYNILAHLGPPSIAYKPPGIIPARIERAPTVSSHRVLGIIYTSAEGNSLEIGTFPQHWGVYSAHRIIPRLIGRNTHNTPPLLLSQGNALQNTRFRWKRRIFTLHHECPKSRFFPQSATLIQGSFLTLVHDNILCFFKSILKVLKYQTLAKRSFMRTIR